MPADAGGGFGILNRTLYGTRDAAGAWNACAQAVMSDELGFVRGRTSPCLFRHETRNIRILVHGDDFVCLGPATELYKLREELSERWLMKFRGMLGKECRDISILNRILRVTADGLEMEADPKHAEIIVKQLWLNDRSNGVTTPGERLKDTPEGLEAIPAQDVTFYRSMTMRAAYLSLDRPGIAFVVKEFARGMSTPTQRDFTGIETIRSVPRERTQTGPILPMAETS